MPHPPHFTLVITISASAEATGPSSDPAAEDGARGRLQRPLFNIPEPLPGAETAKRGVQETQHLQREGREVQ
eukprot:15364563-Alexandrium_andersonii.AAC.1